MTFGRAAFIILLCSAWPIEAQGPAQPPPQPTAPANLPSGGISITSGDPFQGSVASGQATSTPLALSLQDAIDRGLKANLGLLTRETANRSAQAERIRALSALLPNVVGSASETATQIDLAEFGFRFAGFPTVIGPVGFSDVRASASQPIFDWTAWKNRQSAAQDMKASQLTYQDGRDLVVQAVASAYLLIIADAARVDATRTLVATAQTLYERARDQHRAGVSPAIDELRAQVELKTQQQALLSQENQLAKDKLALGRVIGLPSGQVFEVSEKVPFTPLEGLTPDEILRRAYESRADYQSAMMQVHAAETAKLAAQAQRYPTLALAGDYADSGINLANSHGNFAVTGSLKFNIFDGGRIRADEMQADAVIKQRKDELADLQGQIDFQVRSSLLDLKTAADLVAVAQDNLNLANQTLIQARDRFAAGVTDNIEVVQAQDSVAAANQSLISSVYAHNLAKVSLARAVGGTENSLRQFMGGK
jgi:outer membrane protein TolC